MVRDIMMNLSRRWVMAQGVMGACLVTGSDKVSSGFGNGDCVLIDLDNHVFAVADGTERHPRSSRMLLERLREEIQSGGKPESTAEWNELVNTMYRAQEYHLKTTFSLVALSKNSSSGRAYIFNGGDSVVLMADNTSGGLFYMSKVNMNFAGRSKNAETVRIVEYDPEKTRIVLATDGIHDLLRPFDERMSEYIPPILGEHNPAIIPQVISHRIQTTKSRLRGYDDIGVLVVDTAWLHSVDKKCIIMGGTTPNQESSYREILTGSCDDSLVHVSQPGNVDLYGGMTIM